MVRRDHADVPDEPIDEPINEPVNEPENQMENQLENQQENAIVQENGDEHIVDVAYFERNLNPDAGGGMY